MCDIVEEIRFKLLRIVSALAFTGMGESTRDPFASISCRRGSIVLVLGLKARVVRYVLRCALWELASRSMAEEVTEVVGAIVVVGTGTEDELDISAKSWTGTEE